MTVVNAYLTGRHVNTPLKPDAELVLSSYSAICGCPQNETDLHKMPLE